MDILQGRNFEEVLGLYEGRCAPQEKEIGIEKLPVKDKKALAERIFESARMAHGPFRAVKPEDTLLREVEPGFIERKPVLLSSELIDQDVPMTLICEKVFKRDLRGDKMLDEYFEMALLRGDVRAVPFSMVREQVTSETDPDLIADIVVKKVGKNFRIPHRLIGPKFRRQGFGNMMLGAIEEFVKKESKGSEKMLDLQMETSQLDVIFWLLNNGFVPDGEEEQEKLDKILSGDESLCIGQRYNVFPKTVPEEARVHENFSGNFSVNLVKKIERDDDEEVSKQVEGTSVAVDKVSKTEV